MEDENMKRSIRTITAGKEWFRYLSENCTGSSGYGGNLYGMRKLYWGVDAFVVKCSGYLFRVPETVFRRVLSPA